MLTELTKTVHMVVRDIHAVPDEKMLADAVMHDNGTMTPCVGNQCLYEEYADALKAATEFGQAGKTYRVWTVHMHVVRDCAFEPKQPEPPSQQAEYRRGYYQAKADALDFVFEHEEATGVWLHDKMIDAVNIKGAFQ